jgi:hypothetical protein
LTATVRSTVRIFGGGASDDEGGGGMGSSLSDMSERRGFIHVTPLIAIDCQDCNSISATLPLPFDTGCNVVLVDKILHDLHLVVK